MSGEADNDLYYPDTPGEEDDELDQPDGYSEDGFCIPGCPDDVCRNSGHCAWPATGPEREASRCPATTTAASQAR